MNHYVVCFIRDPRYSIGLLIRKNRPEWQAGSLNGVGGRIEKGETPHRAVRREVLEETGLDIPPTSFRLFCHYREIVNPEGGIKAEIWFYAVDYEFMQADRIDGNAVFLMNLEQEGSLPYVAAPLYFKPEVGNRTDESLHIVSLGNLPEDCIDNLHYLIPMAFGRRRMKVEMSDHGPAPWDQNPVRKSPDAHQ